jgi:hypothetical protein
VRKAEHPTYIPREDSLRKSFFAFLALIFCACAFAQSNELAITVGGQFPINNAFDTNAGFAVQGNFAHRFLYVPLAGLYFELPVVVGPKNVLDLPSRSNYSSLFVAPGVKLKIAPEFPVSPYFAVGGGWARYKESDSFGGTSHTEGVFDFAGGVDMKVAPFVSIRGEVRDFYTGSPSFTGIPSGSGRQHNIVPTGGLVLRF